MSASGFSQNFKPELLNVFMQDKYIFVTGGVLSGLGKGLVAASVSKFLKKQGLDVYPVKCDGYLNVDPGTMNPNEHGEVFVLKDGTEVDMDFGHYERFLGKEMIGDQNLTSGKIFQEVISKEREGEYLGETVQMIPHVTDQIKDKFSGEGVKVIEVGGTVGDIENMLYLEALRQLRKENNVCHIHVTLVPYLETTGELKTKPTQHSVKELREAGLQPDIIVGRSEKELDDETREKIALFCDVEKREVISNPDLDSVYKIPLKFKDQEVDEIVQEKLGLEEKDIELGEWRKLVGNMDNGSVARIAICGKYTGMDDTYASVEEALKHAAAHHGGSVEIEYRSTEDIDVNDLDGFDGVIIPGGFGSRGIQGKIDVANYCRENNIPLLGLCLGMQIMTIEYGRNIGIDATSEEFEIDGEEVIGLMPDQDGKKGGTMRLGDYEAELSGQVRQIYDKNKVKERHRHRYEFRPEYYEELQDGEFRISGVNPDSGLAEFIELEDHPFYIGTQAHPEFKSQVENPAPLFYSFIEAAK